MRKLAPRFIALAVAFLVGIGLFTLLKIQTTPEATLSLDDQWHRLYEAAGMSGDDEVFQQVTKSLMCADPYGVPAGSLVEHHDGISLCVRTNGSSHEFRPAFDGIYDSYLQRITKSHVKWSVDNIEFVRSVSTRKKALAYYQQHRSFIR
jgi:hypothetical protein